jgi:UTP:GlnB (protein PII) uridylyltransferase
LQRLRVEAQEKGFLIEVVAERSCCGLLVYILEAFEELGLDVRQARVSCSDSFHLEAIGDKVRK